MTRRWIELLVTLALGVLVVPLAVEAQQPAGKVPRIGFLHTTGERLSCSSPNFLQGLQELGYMEGRTIRIEWRGAEGSTERADQFARELVQLEVDVLVTAQRAAALAAKHATSTIPIICLCGGDPVPEPVPSLTRPGGNLTGVANIAGWEFFAKHLQLLMEAVPGVTRVALLLSAGDPFNTSRIQPVETAARTTGVHLHVVEAEVPQGLEAAFATTTRQGVGALLVSFTPIIGRYRPQIAELAAKHRLPSIAEPRTFAEQGGLMSYGWNSADGWRVVVSYLDRILKGAKPGDLPIQLPTKYDLVINLKTAEALGLTIPPVLLFQATEVIR
jgi:putative tryptophan/tyrosine transport system substrate-binding protein